MPQVIQSDVWQSGPFQDGFEVLVDQTVHIHWPSKFRNKNQDTRPLAILRDQQLDLPLGIPLIASVSQEPNSAVL